MIDRLKEDIRLVRNIHWKSDDKDNMEFIASVSCFQKEALNRLIERVEHS